MYMHHKHHFLTDFEVHTYGLLTYCENKVVGIG